jgi:hypothetical protein
VYNKKPQTIDELRMKKFGQLLSTTICVLIQIDGSADRMNTDKFDVILCVWKECPSEIQCAFKGVVQPKMGVRKSTGSCDENLSVDHRIPEMLVGIAGDDG